LDERAAELEGGSKRNGMSGRKGPFANKKGRGTGYVNGNK